MRGLKGDGEQGSGLCLGNCTGTGIEKLCVFKFEVDVFASETGYFRVAGCDGVQPTLGIERGVRYVFDQSHNTNWFHPLGFAFGPDGVYADNLELGKSVMPPGGGAPCGV